MVGIVDDGQCASCHLGAIANAGPPLAIHSAIAGDQRARKAAGDNFVYDIMSVTNTAPGETPVVTFRVTDPAGTPYDILTDPEFDRTVTGGVAELNLYVQWSTDAYYGGDENGQVVGARINNDLSVSDIQALNFRDTGYAQRIALGGIQDRAVDNGDGSYSVTFFQPLPANFTGDLVAAMGGHPAWQMTDNDGNVYWERGAAVSAVYFPGKARVAAHDSDKCNNCHNRLMEHGANRNGNAEFCLICHNGDAAVCRDSPNPAPDPVTGACPAGNTNEGYSFGRMVHAIHTGDETFELDEPEDTPGWSHVHFPQQPQNCENACHTRDANNNPLWNVARATARAVSTDMGSNIAVWTDDIATTPTAAVCGVCHSDTAARGHFESQGGQVDDLKCTIVGAECTNPDGSAGTGLPNGQEACAVCHGTGSEFETSTFHKPKPGIP
jgi:OmcA/MtrC family decaheme c-type cytochrome